MGTMKCIELHLLELFNSVVLVPHDYSVQKDMFHKRGGSAKDRQFLLLALKRHSHSVKLQNIANTYILR
jgi:hypothetical protein